MRNNKVWIFLAKVVGTVVIFFLCDMAFQYFDTGVINYNKAIRFAFIYGMVLVVVQELGDYYIKKKKK